MEWMYWLELLHMSYSVRLYAYQRLRVALVKLHKMTKKEPLL